MEQQSITSTQFLSFDIFDQMISDYMYRGLDEGHYGIDNDEKIIVSSSTHYGTLDIFHRFMKYEQDEHPEIKHYISHRSGMNTIAKIIMNLKYLSYPQQNELYNEWIYYMTEDEDARDYQLDLIDEGYGDEADYLGDEDDYEEPLDVPLHEPIEPFEPQFFYDEDRVD